MPPHEDCSVPHGEGPSGLIQVQTDTRRGFGDCPGSLNIVRTQTRGFSLRTNSNPVRTAADDQVEGPYNLKKRLPRHVLSRHQSPQINLSTGTLE